MANPTTNFGWVMPTSSSLVTNLPADFNTFGQAVDTSMSELLGGTTGQVLSKTSNTSMDFTWVTPTDQTPLTTKGDLFTFTTVDARLGVGTNGQVLTADSTASTGLAWATPAGGGGKILQVVQATSDTVTTSTSTSFADSNLSATITPSSASSKILVITSQMMRIVRASTGQELSWQLLRGATAIMTYDYATLNGILSINVAANTSGNLALNEIVPLTYLDSPATTSATTYKTQIAAAFTSSSGSVTAQYGGLKSTMILMEVGA